MSKKQAVSSLADPFALIDSFVTDGCGMMESKKDQDYTSMAQRGEVELKVLEEFLAKNELSQASRALSRFGTLKKAELAAALNVRAGGTRTQRPDKAMTVDQLEERIKDRIFDCLAVLGTKYLNEHISALKGAFDPKTADGSQMIQTALDMIDERRRGDDGIQLRRKALKAKLMKLGGKARLDEEAGDRALDSLWGFTSAAMEGLDVCRALVKAIQKQDGREILRTVGHDPYDPLKVLEGKDKVRTACAAALVARQIGWSPKAWQDGYANLRKGGA